VVYFDLLVSQPLGLSVEVIERFIRYLEHLLARYNAALDHREAWKPIEPISKLDNETASELKRRSLDV
jgi:hypothetical protein